ncbi:MAG: ABC transporter substrate-binding protein [Thermoplasmata archaeon]|nr:ABC transporter substrate-binding protein [Thermoplasmata archaeon]
MQGMDSGNREELGLEPGGVGSKGGIEEPRTALSLKKRRPSRKALTIVGSIAVAALALSTVWVLSGTSEPQVTVVAIVPISGVSSYLVEIEDAMSMTVEKLNRWGGINGMRIRLVVEDCGSSPEIAVEKLVEVEERYHPIAVLTAQRGATTPMSEIAEENGIVLISIGATAENLTEEKDWVFRYYVSSIGEAENALETLEGLNVSSLGILHLDDAYGTPLMSKMTAAFESSGGTVESYSFDANRVEFSEAVEAVGDNDAVFAVALRHQFPAIFDGLDSGGYGGAILCAVEASIPEMWALPQAQGCFVSAPIMYSSSATVDTEFIREFEERYRTPLTHQGAIGSDVLRLIWGLLSDSEVSRENLRDQLNSGFVFSGTLGVVTLARGSHNADIPIYPAVIEEGELRYL